MPQLLLSPGIGNSPASSSVPEPSTIALFGFGLLGLAGMRVLRRKPMVG
jgi:hypothetical protein